MKKIKRNITVLSFGDRLDYDEYKKFNKEKHLLQRQGFNYATANYTRVLQEKLPRIRTKKVIIFLFFPFNYWNKNIEHKSYRGMYGNRVFYRKFMSFWKRIDKIIKKNFSGQEVLVINEPLLSGRYRDKRLIELRLSLAKIPVPRRHLAAHTRDIYKFLSKGDSLFLKPRYGSMGKGITYLSWSNWQTNFQFHDDRIISRRSDHGWHFRDITGNRTFLRELIKKDILIEEAVDSLIVKRKKFDLRIYTFFQKCLYIYPKTNQPQEITTNISQGGKGEPGFLQFIPKKLLAKAEKTALKAARALDLKLAGIDIVLDRHLKDVYIVDVNVFPGFPKRRTFNLARSMIKELTRLDNKGELFKHLK
ncbi:MAG: hypothetical protein U9Q24_02350 [Candidatus Ratteibacteria bacterium]|nr:hypothetical protein [Candidatus Ratteibacteria bacterium]